MNSRSSSVLLIELAIAVAVFAACAAVCAAIFADASLSSGAAEDLSNALIAAKNGAECYKACGEAETAAGILGGRPVEGGGIVYYDGGWRACGEAEHDYRLMLRERAEASPPLCEISVERKNGDKIIEFTVAKGGVAR